MIEMCWRFLASFLSKPFIAKAIIEYAKKQEQHKTIVMSSKEYMRRYWIFNKCINGLGIHKWIPFSIRIHNIRLPDEQRHLHNHPFPARTIILRGGYKEEYERGRYRMVGPGSTRFMNNHSYFHQISAIWSDSNYPEEGVWTLFIHGKRSSLGWGFMLDDGFYIPHRMYHLLVDVGIMNPDIENVRELLTSINNHRPKIIDPKLLERYGLNGVDLLVFRDRVYTEIYGEDPKRKEEILMREVL